MFEKLQMRNERVYIKIDKIKYFILRVHKLSGHRGISTIYNNFKNYIQFKGIYQRIIAAIGKCEICIMYKLNSKKRLQNQPLTANYLGEKISSDVFGSFSLEEFRDNLGKNKGFLFTITDIYLRFTYVAICHEVTGETTFRKLEDWCDIFE